MNAPRDLSAVAETAALRMRQRQIGRELRIFFERHTHELVPDDMVEALRRAGERRPPASEAPDT